MGLVQDLLKGIGKNKSEFKERLKEAQAQDKIQSTIEERKKSSNQRELERYMKEEEEKRIKQMLDKINKKRTRDQWKSNSILSKGKSILKDDRPILKEKNIFTNKHNIPFVNGGGMFFK